MSVHWLEQHTVDSSCLEKSSTAGEQAKAFD